MTEWIIIFLIGITGFYMLLLVLAGVAWVIKEVFREIDDEEHMDRDN